MTSLRMTLDDTDFQALVELARASIPAVAPEWTDHNLHDPGMTLLDLLAWTADQQIYALGRQRGDERLSYAAVLGMRPAGPAPARGLIWPEPDAPPGGSHWPNGRLLARGSEITSGRDEAPPFFLEHDTYLTPAQLIGLARIAPDGTRTELPLPQFPYDGAPSVVVGMDVRRGAQLELTLTGKLLVRLAQTDPKQPRPLLAIGFQPDHAAEASGLGELRQGRIRARLRAQVAWEQASVEVPIIHDQTSGFTRSGILLLDLTPLGQMPSGSAVESDDIRLRLILRAALPVRPQLSMLGLNVLAIRQERDRLQTRESNGMPDQEFSIDGDRLRFGRGVAAPKLIVNAGTRKATWNRRERLDDAGPGDPVFLLDTATGIISFGNGVNGKIPPRGALISCSSRECAGKAGNLPSDLSWRVAGLAKPFRNLLPMRGGADRIDLLELRRQARRQVRDTRPLVTDADLETAALAFADLRVARAHVIAGFDARHQTHGGTGRTLVVVAQSSCEPDELIAESAAWLRLLRRRLLPRVPLGDRVRIVGPRYLAIRLRAKLITAPGRNPNAILAQAKRMLQSRLAAVAPCPADPVWPLGRDVAPRDLKGWLRRIPGVVAVPEARIAGGDGPLTEQAVRLPPDGLPLLRLDESDIGAQPLPQGGRA